MVKRTEDLCAFDIGRRLRVTGLDGRTVSGLFQAFTATSGSVTVYVSDGDPTDTTEVEVDLESPIYFES